MSVDAGGAPRLGSPTLLEVTYRGGIWQVTRDGHFYGHYHSPRPACDAAQAAANEVVAGGGAAELRLSGVAT